MRVLFFLSSDCVVVEKSQKELETNLGNGSNNKLWEQ